MNIEQIKARININYREVVEKIINDESISFSSLIIWSLKELTTLQKYILELLMDRMNQQIKIRELING